MGHTLRSFSRAAATGTRKTVNDAKIAGFPHIYIQGPHALERLPDCIRDIVPDARVAIIADPVVTRHLVAMSGTIEASGARVHSCQFNGECTREEIDRLSLACTPFKPDIIVGAGGGKALDTAKGVALQLGSRLVIVPTIASSDAPTSRLIAIYDAQHRIIEVPCLKRNPDAVIVDTAILVAAPQRFFVAGMGDALTKKFEVGSARRSNRRNYFAGLPTELTGLLADRCYEIIRSDAIEALRAIEDGVPNAAFERVVEASILHSGLAFESGGLSIAHGLLRGLTPFEQTQAYLHGELVAYGLLVQLATHGFADVEILELMGFLSKIGLPTCLADIGLAGLASSDFQQMAELTLTVPYVSENDPPVSIATLVEGIAKIERLSAH
tara:strand:- start:23364 stop:24512 length:1149 start_codon:yes stop_codon:yes gene_type:complete